MTFDELAETIRDLPDGIRIRVSLADDEPLDSLTLYTVDEPDYIEPDQYGGGGVDVITEVDTDVHEVPSDALPTESVVLEASTSLTGEWKTAYVEIWDPVVEDSYIVDDEWILYRVTGVERLD